MRFIDGHLRLSASDLMRFKGCRHATALDLQLIEVGNIVPAADDDEALLLQRQGDAHELAFLERLKLEKLTVVEIPKDGLSLEESVRLTHAAMADGPDVIFQGALLGGSWGGYSDFLERIERPSSLGAWSYEVVDTKLKRKPDPKHVLQLSLYSDLLADVHPHGVFNQRILLRTATLTHNTGDGLVLRHALARDQKFQRSEAAASGGDFELAGFIALIVQHRADVEALQQRSPHDVIGQLADGHVAFLAADIGLAKHQPVKGDVARTAERELRN